MQPHLQGDGADVLRRSSSATPECSLPTGLSSPSNAYAGLSLDSDRDHGDRDHEMTNGDGDVDRDGGSNRSPPMVVNSSPPEVNVSSSNESSYRPARSASPAVKRPASELDDHPVIATGPSVEVGSPLKVVSVPTERTNVSNVRPFTLAVQGANDQPMDASGMQNREAVNDQHPSTTEQDEKMADADHASSLPSGGMANHSNGSFNTAPPSTNDSPPKQDENIVLEERVREPASGSGDGKSEAGASTIVNADIPISITKGKFTTVKNAAKKGSTAGSRNASPAPSATRVMTRGRARKNGTTLGTSGLGNLGNTCYMNSALQCVRSVEELSQYFQWDKYKADLNPTNHLAYNGEVARSYANLLGQIYAPSRPASVIPRTFKAVIGRHRLSFSGFGQQDSQEFLGFLLDGLQEDLYRAEEKPSYEIPDSTDEMVTNPVALRAFADECWELYKARNDSVIVDLFAGTYKSTLVCLTCHKVSITFDPFNNLTVQLPIETIWSKEVIFMPLEGRPIRVAVDMDKNGSIRMLKEFVSSRVHVEVERLFAAEVYKNKFYKIYEDADCASEAIVSSDDKVYVYELESAPTNWPPPKKDEDAPTSPPRSLFTSKESDEEEEEETPSSDSPLANQMLVPVLHRVPPTSTSRYASPTVVDLPFYMIITAQDANDYDALLKKVLARVATLTTRDIFAEGSDEGSNTPEEDVVVVVSTEDTDSSDARTKTHSVEGEDDLVAVDMKDSRQPSQMESSTEQGAQKQNQQQQPRRQKHRRPKALEPGSFIPGELQRMFQMRVFKCASGEMVPSGWSSSLESNKEFPLVQARIPGLASSQSSPERDANGSPPSSQGSSSGSDPLQYSHELPNRSFAVPEGDSDSDSNSMSGQLPPIGKLLANGRKGPKARVMGRTTRKGRRNGARPKHTYSRKPRIESEAESVDVETPGPLIRLGEGLILDWDPAVYASLFAGRSESDVRGMSTWDHAEILVDEELQRKREFRANRRKNGVTLEDCLDEFAKEEILSESNAWRCPNCKAERQASKKLELWKAPDILIIHLKRFSATRRLQDKINVFVDFPVEGLDLTKRVAMKEEGKEAVYDLIAVDNHYGGLGGGHYTAIARNFLDGEWYDYNDTHASKRSPQAAVTSAAYLLFYRRRSTGPLGGPYFERMMEEAQEHQESPSTSSRSSSPAGDEARFGDSSRAGSSNELHEARVGANRREQTHNMQQGASTSMAVVPYQRSGQHQQQEEEEEGTVRMTTEHDQDELPGYSSLYPTGTIAAVAGPPTLNLGPSASVIDPMDIDEGIDTSYNDEPSLPSITVTTGHPLTGTPSWGFDHLRTGVTGGKNNNNNPSGQGGAATQNSSDEDLMAGASDKAAGGGSSIDANLSDTDDRMAQFGDDDGDEVVNNEDLKIHFNNLEEGGHGHGHLLAHYRDKNGYGGHDNDLEEDDDDVHGLPPSAARSSPVNPAVTNIALDPDTQKLYLRSMTGGMGRGGGGGRGGAGFGGGGFLTADDEADLEAEGEVRVIGANVGNGNGDNAGDEEEEVAEVRVDEEEEEQWGGGK